ncbi:MAG: hydroxymyristoyl-ACP dehydratase [Bacteroidia bacterium]|nr:hydroxymyristoyl-ACP dehydratase [Bacteroidia bacterium]
MLLNDFYTIHLLRQVEETLWATHLRLNPKHRLYEGHFPEVPVLPGVCMLQLIKESSEAILDCPLTYATIKSCKFLAMINPTETTDLDLQIKLTPSSEGYYSLEAEGKSLNNPFIKLKATLTTRTYEI